MGDVQCHKSQIGSDYVLSVVASKSLYFVVVKYVFDSKMIPVRKM